MTTPLWQPNSERIQQSPITAFIQQVESHTEESFGNDYHALHRWSVTQCSAFWEQLWAFTQPVFDGSTVPVCEQGENFQSTRWFPNIRLNYAENLLRRRDDHTALVSLLENGERRTLSYADLYTKVAQLAASLRAQGVEEGDRVAGFMPNIEETVVAMLATTSIGALWSSCSPDFGISGVMDRFGQIAPKVLFAADGYYYNGKQCDSTERIAAISAQIDSLEKVIVVPLLKEQPDLSGIDKAVRFPDYLDTSATEIVFNRVAFNHPLFIMYSSGTTGVPKCIVHGTGGTLLQHLKEHQLQTGIGRDDVFFYFTTCGWMMWNWLVSGLASGATVVLFDGSPFADEGRVLLDAIDREGISVFGTSAKYIAALEKAGHKPRESHQLTHLKSILSTGSPLSHESFAYVYRDFKADVCLSSISGGTDILSCFVGGCPILPVYTGEIQAPGLGMAVEIWDDEGNAVTQEKGELVCTQPFPCVPVGFWNDPEGAKFHSAYFDRFPNIWAHGDYGEITAAGGVIIHGRSDAVLNPGGVRIGTAEIYRQVEKNSAVLESVVIGQQWQDDVRVVLFVVLKEGHVLDDDMVIALKKDIRQNTTPRHVPERIVQVADIPRTISGKIAELAVRDVVQGREIKNTDALANPQALDLFKDLPALQD